MSTYYEEIGRVLGHYKSCRRVLEIGAGNSPYRNIFANHIAIDLPGSPYVSPGAINVFADARVLPFKSASFDLCFAVSVMHLIPSPELAFSEVHRVLKSGGHFLMFDIPLRYKKRNLENASARQEFPFMSLWTRREALDLLSRAGFIKAGILDWPVWAITVNCLIKKYEPANLNWIVYHASAPGDKHV